MSRQLNWQQRKREAGLCIICGKEPAIASGRCTKHYALHKVYARRRGNYGAWHEGGPGKRPRYTDAAE